MVRRSASRIGLVLLLLLSPAAALAQSGSGIAGVVRDTSGAVLPGVTVEAASPALIEKSRSARICASRCSTGSGTRSVVWVGGPRSKG